MRHTTSRMRDAALSPSTAQVIVHVWKDVTNVTEVLAGGYDVIRNVGYDKTSWCVPHLPTTPRQALICLPKACCLCASEPFSPLPPPLTLSSSPCQCTGRYLDNLDVTWDKVYANEPCAGVPDALCPQILGGHGEMWGRNSRPAPHMALPSGQGRASLRALESPSSPPQGRTSWPRSRSHLWPSRRRTSSLA